MSRQLHAPAALPPGKEPLVPMGRRVSGPQNCSGRGGGIRYYSSNFNKIFQC